MITPPSPTHSSPYRPIAVPVTYSFGETEHPDQPVHRRARVLIQEIGNDLRARAVVRHDSHATAARRASFTHTRTPEPDEHLLAKRRIRVGWHR